MSQALITLSSARENLHLTALVQENAAELRTRLRGWYQEALAENFIVQLQLLAESAGTLQTGVFTFTDPGDKPLLITYNRQQVAVTVHVGEKVVCDNRVAGQEMLLPGKWIRRVVEILDEMEAQQRANAERERLSEHHQILSIFADTES